ncbi:synaptotagmin-like protein 2 isoform X13 [Engystomops pustulosus]|uniref:synaptotagmin-like protein 2 isoform X13 n=1 Tax=Engystomops pustulosus TaxID=76066 RepID=UPI003AFB1378
MIDLSFLTEAEQEAILKVLNRDAELKKTEDQRVRELQDKVNDENELKYKSGQWFYEAKSRRHRDKIHGADLVRASIRKRKKPATIAELSQSSRNQSQRSWVNSINQDIFIPPELYGVMEPPDEKEEDLMPSKADTNQSAKRVSFKSPGTDKDVMKNGTASPSRQRKNPFNSEGALEERDLNIESPEPMLVNGQEGKKRGTEPLYAEVKKSPKSTSSDQAKDTKPDSSEVLKSKQENKYPTEKVEASDSNEEVNETIEKTVIPPKTDLDDFDRKLQNLYNESLNTIDLPNGHMIKPENVDINEPTLNIGKVLQVSPINQDKNVQSPVVATGLQPVAINFSSKKTEMVNEDLDKPQQNIPTETTSADVSTEPLVDVNFYEVPKISSEKPTYELNGSSPRKLDINELSSEPNDYKVPLPEPEKQTKKEIMERIEEPVVLPRPRFDDFHEKLNQLYEESQKSQPNIGDSNNIAENETVGAENKANVYLYPVEPKKTFLESSPVNLDSSQIVSADPETLTDESAPPHSQAPDILGQEVNETMAKTIAPKRISTAKSLEELQKEALNEQEGGFVGNVPSGHMILNESHSNDQELKENSILETFPRNKDDAVQWRTEPTGYEELQEGTAESSAPFMAVRQSTPVKDKNSSLRKSTLELYLEAPYRRELSKSIDFDLSAYVTSDVNQCMDESNPILKALQRSTAKTLNSTAVQETSPTSTNQSKLNSQKADTLGPVENTFPENAEKFKRMSQSVPTFLQDETDGRETDSASESSFQIGRHKKSPSSLTNLSGSSGMASMSSVSGSVMSVYSGDFGNVDVKGAIEFAIDYVEQLKEFHIFIYQCKDLAAADVKKQRSDPYVKSYLLPEKAKMGKRKTAVKKKTLNPIYNEILRYKIPQESLKSQTLNVSVWHHDALGRNSFLGEVNLNLAMWDFKVSQRHWFPLEPRTPVHGVGLENRGEMKLALMYIPVSPHETGKKPNTTGEVHIWIKECLQLPMLRENKINSFVKCTILPDTSRKSRQKTRTIDKTQSPFFNHTMVYDGFKEADLREACVELTAWDHNKLSNHFIGGLRLGFGTGKSYGTAVDWMDSSLEEATMWEKMIASPSTWIEGLLPLRMFKMAKLSKYT